ncbi:efflux RND transporter periplasmic adaptor subunit [uncultured Bacteroides sp.]|uniref:efflux RND transporter periplasmic adaptor subunit n=1 Tax=uncultured Bacteroides sp. TaxID=162156 RepID=UPI0025E91295|nr:efflux RND transporter periplasmic adaptor subunit [uncultured Bacteroides sp.]
MKTYIIGLFIVTAILLTGCNSNKKTENKKEDKHEHVDGDGHDHANEKDHKHAEGDGHDHSNDKEHKHTDGDGHDHANEKDHKHSEGDGHDHGAEATEDSHTDEILFSKEQAQLVGLKTETVAPSSFYNSIKTSGQIQASQGDEAVIAATSNGIVSFTNPSITDGTAVKAGQSIVTISAKKLLEGDPSVKARIEYETAQKEFQRAESLVKDQIISAKDFEQARLRYETAKTVYQAQAGNMTAAGVSVTAPIAGYIKNRLVAQGEYVSVGQPIATVSQNRRLQLRAEVSENNFKILKSISSANFKPAYDNVVYKLSELNGRLLSFGKASTDQSFYIPVTFEFDNVGDIIPGAYTEVYLLSTLQENVISVPVSAITEEQGLNFVYLQTGAEEYKKQEVTLGQNNGERVQILSGLPRGAKVVTKGVYQVKLAATSSVMPEGHSH